MANNKDMKSKEFLRSKGILSNDAHHFIIDFHDGREINLADLLEDFAQQSQPSGMRWVRASERLPDENKTVHLKWRGFKKLGFYDGAKYFNVGDTLLIANYMMEWLDESSPAGAAEGASEGMAEALRECINHGAFTFYCNTNNCICCSECKMPLTQSEFKEKLASLSPGVEDGSGWVKELNERQKSGMVHPYTCDRKHKDCEVNCQPRDYSKDGVLIATEYGWICPCGRYAQPLPTPPGVEDNQTKKQ